MCLKIDPTTISAVGAVLTTLVATCSTGYTVKKNNEFQIKMKELENQKSKLENLVLHKRDIFEKYVAAAKNLIFTKNNENTSEYGEYYSRAYLYADEPLRVVLAELDVILQERIKKHNTEGYRFDHTEAMKRLNTLIPMIDKYIESLISKT